LRDVGIDPVGERRIGTCGGMGPDRGGAHVISRPSG